MRTQGEERREISRERERRGVKNFEVVRMVRESRREKKVDFCMRLIKRTICNNSPFFFMRFP